MKYYFAPLEGINGYIFRNIHRRHFKGIDKYFAPFITPNESKKVMTKELVDLLPENNEGIPLVPQILTNNASGFISTAQKLSALGYTEININLGCPSGTVVAKNKGSGFLAFPLELDRFLDEIYSSLDMQISIKTRLGRNAPEEFYELLKIYNKYPVKELIIHPRIRQDFYKGHPRMEYFEYAVKESVHPVCYNGDLFAPEDVDQMVERFPDTDRLMFGRGILMNPALSDICAASKIDALTGMAVRQKVIAFYNDLYEAYKDHMFGERNVLFKMKELWFYLIEFFPRNEKNAKKIKKAQKLADYEAAVRQIFG